MKNRIVYCDELAGLTVKCTDGTTVIFRPHTEGEQGGVREPRRPKPKAPVTAV